MISPVKRILGSELSKVYHAADVEEDSKHGNNKHQNSFKQKFIHCHSTVSMFLISQETLTSHPDHELINSDNSPKLDILTDYLR